MNQPVQLGSKSGQAQDGRIYLLGLLTSLNCLLVLDKIVLSILIEPIRAELACQTRSWAPSWDLSTPCSWVLPGCPWGCLRIVSVAGCWPACAWWHGRR